MTGRREWFLTCKEIMMEVETDDKQFVTSSDVPDGFSFDVRTHSLCGVGVVWYGLWIHVSLSSSSSCENYFFFNLALKQKD
jgi:hypothetical protein